MTDHLTAYARALGIVAAEAQAGDAPLLSLPFDDSLEGRPGAWHGGAIAGLLETAGYAALRTALEAEGRNPQVKPVNVTVQYLSTGRTRESHARGRVVRLGRRVANLSIEAWQDDPTRPIATAIMNVMLVDPDPAP